MTRRCISVGSNLYSFLSNSWGGTARQLFRPGCALARARSVLVLNLCSEQPISYGRASVFLSIVRVNRRLDRTYVATLLTPSLEPSKTHKGSARAIVASTRLSKEASSGSLPILVPYSLGRNNPAERPVGLRPEATS